MSSSKQEDAARPADSRRVFVSYSRRDRRRVDGLAVLLEALGHQVFVDRRKILPGDRWREHLLQGIAEADVLLVFWTRAAADSKWVRRECRLFRERLSEGRLVPVRGDETKLPDFLEDTQYLDLFPLLNELLELQRELREKGVRRPEVRRAILARLEEAGIEIDAGRRRKLMGLFGFAGLLGTSSTALAAAGARLVETAGQAAAQLSLAQAGIVVAAAVTGGAICTVADRVTDPLASLGREERALVASIVESHRGGGPSVTMTPRLEGLTEDAARKYLREHRLLIGEVTAVPTDQARAGTVLDQEPAHAEPIVLGGSVHLTLAAPLPGSSVPAPRAGLEQRLDLVFVIDVTSSMGAELTAVKEVVSGCTEDLRARGIDVRYAGYSFTDAVPYESSLPFAAAEMDPDADLERFQSWLRGLELQTAENLSTEENGLDALRLAFGLGFQPEADSAIVLVSDAPPFEAGHPESPTDLTVERLLELKPPSLRILVASPSERYGLLGERLSYGSQASDLRRDLLEALLRKPA